MVYLHFSPTQALTLGQFIIAVEQLACKVYAGKAFPYLLLAIINLVSLSPFFCRSNRQPDGHIIGLPATQAARTGI
jgi:hypothetical protein